MKGEYAPVYDEFGAILLLVLAFVHRFGLTYYDIGISSDSFVAEYLEKGHLSIMIDDLTPDQDRQLGGWLKGLFSPDSGEGVSDDLMSSCRPQDFYLLVPTLFNQLVLACSSEALTLDAVKSGLDCMSPPLPESCFADN
jgi:mediator of RNA polymerase II transcription subunit 5